MKRFMIAGTKSGVGKTTVSMGLMAALSKRYVVQPFKVGPDYIDPAFHSYITDRQCRNLDSYMLSEEMIHFLFTKNMSGADIGIAEGVMGLFDGAEVGSDIGTSASIAKILKLPLILVVDGSKVATSLAATVKGFEQFDPDLRIDGVIINNVGSSAHYDLLKRGIEYHTNVKPCGYLLKNSCLSLPERHLGLVPAGELEELDEVFSQLADQIEATVDIDGILALAEQASNNKSVSAETSWDDLISGVAKKSETVTSYKPVRIGIAKDNAFTFYYQDALDLLEEYYGVEWVPFSPLRDVKLPEGLHGLYFGGGFPEMFGSDLEANLAFKENLKESLADGIPYVAECGGLMYLCKSLSDLEGNSYEMVGWFNGSSEMTQRLQRFGYAELTLSQTCVYGDQGDTIKVHEFHRSFSTVEEPMSFDLCKTRYGEVIKAWECGYTKGNGIGGYAHSHYCSNPEFAKSFVDKCYEYGKKTEAWK